MSSERQRDAAIEALAEASAAIRAFDVEQCDTNTLSALGNLVSTIVRRRVLLEELRRNEWNLTWTSEELNIGGAGSVTHMIRDLGLSEEYRAARKAGAGKPGPKGRAMSRARAEQKEGVR